LRGVLPGKDDVAISASPPTTEILRHFVPQDDRWRDEIAMGLTPLAIIVFRKLLGMAGSNAPAAGVKMALVLRDFNNRS
jgi:hypothetical protein